MDAIFQLEPWVRKLSSKPRTRPVARQTCTMFSELGADLHSKLPLHQPSNKGMSLRIPAAVVWINDICVHILLRISRFPWCHVASCSLYSERYYGWHEPPPDADLFSYVRTQHSPQYSLYRKCGGARIRYSVALRRVAIASHLRDGVFERYHIYSMWHRKYSGYPLNGSSNSSQDVAELHV